jgi:hypothetical protein
MGKTLINLFVIALLGIAFASFSFADNTITLHDAIAQKKVQVMMPEFGPNGYSAGVRVNVINISGKNLKLIMPKGTIFIPDNGEEQTLVTSGDEVFALNAGQQKQIVRPGYCTEYNDGGSEDESTFKLGMSQNEKLLSIIRFMDSLKIAEKDVVQHAIWCVTDGNPIGYIGLDDTTKERKLRERLCSLTGQKMPWYETEAEIEMTPEREFVILSKTVEGELSFYSKDAVNMQGVVKDSTGKVVWTNPNNIAGPKGNVTFWYKLTVEGWDPGKYYVVYNDRGKEIINQEFEL